MKIKVEKNAEIIGHPCQSRMRQQGYSRIKNNPNIFGDIVGAFCIFGMLFIGLFFVGVLQ